MVSFTSAMSTHTNVKLAADVSESHLPRASHPLHRPAPVPDNDVDRLDVLKSLSLLDTDNEEAFDRITQAAAATLKVSKACFAVDASSSLSPLFVLRLGFTGCFRVLLSHCYLIPVIAPWQFPTALVSLVDKDRQWFKSAVGLGVKETHRDLAMCSHVIYKEGSECMVVSDTWQVRNLYIT